jgi:hypothetical protein
MSKQYRYQPETFDLKECIQPKTGGVLFLMSACTELNRLAAQVATMTADLARVTAERDILQLTIDAIECKLIAFDDEAGEYAEEDELIYLWMASVNGKGRRFETAVEAFIALRSASNGGPACTPDPTS